MGLKQWWPAILGGLCLVGIVAASYLFSPARRPDRTADRGQSDKPIEQPTKVVKESVPSDWIDVGGVKRPPSDVKLTPTSDSDTKPKGIVRPTPMKQEGFAAPIPADTNAQTTLVSQALKDGKNPERYSSLIVPKSFDREAFSKDPQSYAKQYAEDVEPGRVYASAQPGEGVPVIRSEGSRFHRVKQGETVRLVVESAPHVPVSFLSQNHGNFSNSLTSITVVADADGKASTEFTASAGTKDKVDILAASPVTSGQVAFVVMVSLGSS